MDRERLALQGGAFAARNDPGAPAQGDFTLRFQADLGRAGLPPSQRKMALRTGGAHLSRTVTFCNHTPA